MVDILLATYNGEKYISEQIDSILRQTFKDWRLIVHDDGSTDNTVEIIKKYALKDKRVLVVEDGITRLGVAENFIHLLQYSNAEYCMFCDQDDVWFEDKVEVMLNRILKQNNKIPQLVFSNAYLWDGKEDKPSGWATLTYPKALNELLFLNCGIQGAASIFNDELKKILLRKLDNYAMHDHVLILAALSFGEVIYIHQALMYYRQHNTNITGKASGSIKDKFTSLISNRDIPVIDKKHYDAVVTFYEEYKDRLSEEKRKILEDFLSIPSQSFFKRIQVILKDNFTIYDSKTALLLKILIRKFI